eukprot:Opistho-2@96748
MGDEEDVSRLSLEDRLMHKSWKVRVAAYDDAVKEFTRADDPDSPDLLAYASLLPKIVADSNANAQEKSIDAVRAFCEKASCASRCTGELATALVKKCFNQRDRTKQKAMDLCLLLIEIDKSEPVITEVMGGLSDKQPKVVIACIQTIFQALSQFGAKNMTLKPICKDLHNILENKDKTVREEAKALVVEMYRWLGQAVKPFLDGLNPILLKDLDAAFEALPKEKAVQKRFLRSQQAEKERTELIVAAGGDPAAVASTDADTDDIPDADADPYDFADATDVLGLMSKTFFDDIAASKWQTRKECLEGLLALVSKPKAAPGEYGELVRCLSKAVSDSNVVVVALAVQCIGGLAKGLRTNFSHYAVGALAVLLRKFKEKKTNVVAALRIAVDAAGISCPFANLAEETAACLDDKNPSVKAETALRLGRILRETPRSDITKPVLKQLIAVLILRLDDGVPEVREAAMEALGVSMKAVGEAAVMPYLADIDKTKLAKIQEHCQNTVLSPSVLRAAIRAAKAAKAKEAAKANGTAPAKGAPAGKAAPGGAKKAPAKKVAGAPAASAPAKKTSAAPAKAEEFPEPAVARSASVSEKKTGPVAAAPTSLTLKKTSAAGAKASDSPADSRPKTAVSADSVRAKAAGAQEEDGPALLVGEAKEVRMEKEKKNILLRWTFEAPRDEFVVQLKDQMQPILSRSVFTQLFHEDFKHHIAGMGVLATGLTSPAEGVDAPLKAAGLANADLLLRYVTLRFFDTNTSVMLKCLELIRALFTVLDHDAYHLSEYEAYAFIPYLVMRVGDKFENVRKDIRSLFRVLCNVYPASKLFGYLLDGLKIKNARSRTELLEELATLIQRHGIAVCQPSPAKTLPQVAIHVGDRDNGVRSAAINVIIEAHALVGDAVWKYAGEMSQKDRDFIEERIKRNTAVPKKSAAAPAAKQAPTVPEPAVFESVQEPVAAAPAKAAAPSAPKTPSKGGVRARVISKTGGLPMPASVVAASNAHADAEIDVPTMTIPAPAPVAAPAPAARKAFSLDFEFDAPISTLSSMPSLRPTSADSEESTKPAAPPAPTAAHTAIPLRPSSAENVNNAQPQSQPPAKVQQKQQQQMPTKSPVAIAPSPSGRRFKSVDLYVTQVNSDDLQTSNAALKQIEAILAAESDTGASVRGHEDALLGAITLQLRLVFLQHIPAANQSLSASGDAQSPVMRVLRRLISVLLAFFRCTPLAMGVKGDVLEPLTSELMHRLLDDSLGKMKDGPQIVRAMNGLAIKVLESSDRNTMFSVLLQMLSKSCTQHPTTKYCELVMKCMWKLTRALPQIAGSIDKDRLVADCELFLRTHPPSSRPVSTGEDLPLRTVKTLLHATVGDSHPTVTVVDAVPAEQHSAPVNAKKDAFAVDVQAAAAPIVAGATSVSSSSSTPAADSSVSPVVAGYMERLKSLRSKYETLRGGETGIGPLGLPTSAGHAHVTSPSRSTLEVGCAVLSLYVCVVCVSM